MTEFNISPSVETQKEISEILDEAIEKLRDRGFLLTYQWISIEFYPDMKIKEIKIINDNDKNPK